MKQKILNTIMKYNLIGNNDSIIVGVSGGPDSMCLLDALNEINKDENINLKFEIYVAHVNHMIRKEADSETEYVREFCKKNSIEFFVKKENVLKLAKEQKIGTEEAGRKLRYDFFNEIATKTKSNKIATAHNLNDKVETILMNIIRGTGPLGLKGIEPSRDNGKYIRPLIEIQRDKIEEYCEQRKLEPKFDKTNKENIYTRNKIRNMLIPYIKKEFNPNIIEAINRLSLIITDEQNYLQKNVNNIYEQILLDESKDEVILDLKKFNKLDLVIKRKIILYTINRLFNTTKGIEKTHIEDIIKLCENNIGNKYLTPNKNTKVFVKKGKIFLSTIH